MGSDSLILLPGMGADARMFRPQQQAFPQLQIAEWTTPEPRETIARYAERMSERIALNGFKVVSGASFGGVVALEMAALIPVRKCILIGSLRSPAGLRSSYLRLQGLSSLSALAPGGARAGLWLAGAVCTPSFRGILRQLADADGRFLSWAVRALLEWNPSANIANVVIAQIHGQKDWLLPARSSQADQIVPGAGHLLSLTHPREVNDFIRNQLGSAPEISP